MLEGFRRITPTPTAVTVRCRGGSATDTNLICSYIYRLCHRLQGLCTNLPDRCNHSADTDFVERNASSSEETPGNQ